MLLTTSQIMEVAHMQSRISMLTHQIKKLQDVAKGLANDHCETRLNMVVHNCTLHEKNKAMQEAAAVDATNDAIANAAAIGVAVNLPEGWHVVPVAINDHATCCNAFEFVVNEPGALRLLQVLMDDKRRERIELTRKLHALVLPSSPQIVENAKHNH
jgi:hypothetical protein